jgi:hypothetical protein
MITLSSKEEEEEEDVVDFQLQLPSSSINVGTYLVMCRIGYKSRVVMPHVF